MQFWTHKPKNGSLFFVVVPHDAYELHVRPTACLLVSDSETGRRNRDRHCHRQDRKQVRDFLPPAMNFCSRELVGAQVIYGSLDSTCIKSIRVYSRLRYPHEYLRSYRQDAMADPVGKESCCHARMMIHRRTAGMS
eukprot:754532-Hanusia_phi.AAC.5